MARIGLAPGAFGNFVAFALSGAGAVTGATANQFWLQVTGWTGMVIGLLYLRWGFTIDGEHWWREWWPVRTTRCPIGIANLLFVDCVPVTDPYQMAKTPIWSVNLNLQISNRQRDGKTLKKVQAFLENEWGDRVKLPFLEGRKYREEVELRSGKIELLEVGYVLVIPETEGLPAKPRIGDWRRPLSASQIEMAFHDHANNRKRLHISGNDKLGFHDGTSFRVLVTAEDAPAFPIMLRVNLSAKQPYGWLKRVKRTM